jgi:diguanylate cyclase (GGDEF)-like protein/PAS domain S-box-containing protein
VENLFDGVYYVDRLRTITYWNPAAERITGFSADEVVGRRCFDNILGHVDEAGTSLCRTACPLAKAMAQRRGTEAEVFLHHRDGHRVPVHVRCQAVRDPDGVVIGGVEIFNEDTSFREALNRIESLERLSSVDPLTGLLNRRAGEMSVRSRQHDVDEAGWPLGVLFVDIDRFKSFNDAHGHAVGDMVLKVAARSVAASLRESDVAIRWGGDEFLVITAASDAAQIGALASRVRALVAASHVQSGGSEHGITVSVGAALAVPGDTVETLVARADTAMYAVKAQGGNGTAIAA